MLNACQVGLLGTAPKECGVSRLAFDCTWAGWGGWCSSLARWGCFSEKSVVALAVDYVCKLGQVASRSVKAATLPSTS